MRSMRRSCTDLCRTPRFGLSADRDAAGRFRVRRGDAAVSLDDEVSNIPPRIESLARRNVGLQLIGPPPGFASWPEGAAGVEYARTLNEHGARVVAQGQGRLELMVTLPLGEPERCAYELERALDLYGARSALLPATAAGQPLDTGAFDDMFSLAERRGILLFLHPVSAEPPSRFPFYALQLVVQWPAETCIAVARMIFGGFFERFPRMKIAARAWRRPSSVPERAAQFGLRGARRRGRCVFHRQDHEAARRLSRASSTSTPARKALSWSNSRSRSQVPIG